MPPTLNELAESLVQVPRAKVQLPNEVGPSLNVTLPVGVPEPGVVALTVAMKLTLLPNTVVLSDDVTVVVVGFFFFKDTANTEIHTLPLHDALPISFTVCNTVLELVSKLPSLW